MGLSADRRVEMLSYLVGNSSKTGAQAQPLSFGSGSRKTNVASIIQTHLRQIAFDNR